MAQAATTGLETREYQLFINGEWVAPQSGETRERRNPANLDDVVARFPWADEADTERAVQAARAAFDAGPWPRLPARERAHVLLKAAARLREEAPNLAVLLTREVGKPVREAFGEVLATADVLEYYGGMALDVKGEAISNFVPTAFGITIREPVGVAAIITPWNFPLLLASWKLAPALAIGCTTVSKPSDLTPCTTFELARILQEAGAPPGVVNVVTGDGPTVGGYLAASHAVDKIAFTGSTATGRKVMQAASGNLKKISLELGGKSPNIIFEDADLDEAVQGALFGIFLNQGEVCQAGSRLLVQASVHDRVVERLVEATRALKPGNPLDRNTTMGAIVSQAQLEKIQRYLEAGQREGADLLVGGSRLTGGEYDQGYYVEPTIFDGVRNEMTIARDEIFGPVLAVIPFRDADDALRIANDTIYGLAAGVWTRNVDTMFTMFKGLKAGMVFGNCYHSAGLSQLPFGGYKQSGIGRELGTHGLDLFTEVKSLQLRLH